MKTTTAFAATLAAVCITSADAGSFSKDITKGDVEYAMEVNPTYKKEGPTVTLNLILTLTAKDTSNNIEGGTGFVAIGLLYADNTEMNSLYNLDSNLQQVCSESDISCWWPSDSMGPDGTTNIAVTNGVADIT